MPFDPSRPSRRARWALVAVLLGTTGLGGFAASRAIADNTQPAAPASQATSSNTPIQPAAPAQVVPDFAALVKRVSPAVVSVTTHLNQQAALAAEREQGGDQGGDQQGQMQTPFGMMPFGMSPFGMVPQQPQHAHPVEAKGSGFIINADGTVVTNNHVVEGAKTVSVTLDDGTTYTAKVVGTDPRTDLAVLHINANRKLPFLQLGDSGQVQPGQWVIAMGNPFGLSGTVTAGIVSAKGRDIGEGPYDNFIQVDAPINRGNSGGPLFTQNGEVVGVNTAILSPSGGSIGIGFAIPSNTVRTVVDQIERSGHVTRGYLGVETQPITPGIAAALKLGANGEKAGALVASVEPGSPAAKAGVQAGDVITGVNGQKVDSPRTLAVDVANLKPGSDAKIDVLRDRNQQTLTAKLATLEPVRTASAGDNGNGGGNGGRPSIGLALAPLSQDVRGQLNLPSNTTGAVIEQVRPGSAADQAGLRQGDVVVGVGAKAVSSPEDAVTAIRGAETGNKDIALRILRDGHSVFVAVAVPQGGQGGDQNLGQGNGEQPDQSGQDNGDQG